MRHRIGLLVLLAMLGTAPARFYQGQSLICAEADGAGMWELWLGGDGRYTVFSARPGHGTAHRGAYQAIAAAGGIRLCLRPDPPAEAGPFTTERCDFLPVRPIGEVFEAEMAARRYRFVLVQGR